MHHLRPRQSVRGGLAHRSAGYRCRANIPVALTVVLLTGFASPAHPQQTVSSAGPPASPVSGAVSAHPYALHVTEASQRFGIPEAWIWSVMRVESAGNPAALSHAGAMGLMQVMPGTYAELRARYGLGPDAYEPRDNILAGAAYLREMHDRYGSAGFLAAYNAGPGRWEDHVSRGRPLPAETVAYMARLGPMIGGSAAPATTTIPQIDRFAWRRAALFVAVSEIASTTISVHVEGQFTADQPQADGRAPTDVVDPSAGDQHALFAVRRPK